MIQTTKTQYVNILYDIPNPKDKNQWYAGGILRNESFSGGVNFSSLSIPSYNNKKQTADISVAFFTGNFIFLNSGYSLVTSLVDGGVLDLMRYTNETKHIKIDYDLTITNTITKDIISSNSGSFTFSDDGIKYDDIMTTQDIFDIYNAPKVNLFDADILTVSLSMIDSLTREEFDISKTVQSVMLNATLGRFKSLAIEQGLKTFGLSGFNIATFGIIGAISSIFNEAVEIALGLDNHFGFGGEFVGKVDGVDAYTAPIDTWQGIKDTFLEIVTLGFIDTQTYNPTTADLVDKDGNSLGSASFSPSGTFSSSTNTNMSGVTTGTISSSTGFQDSLDDDTPDGLTGIDDLDSGFDF